MTYRVQDEVTQDNNGHQQAVYNFGSVASKLSATASEAKIDTGDPIRGDALGGVEMQITNDDASATLYVKMYNAEDDDADWDTNPERFAEIGSEITIGPDTSKVVNWSSKYKAITVTKRGSGTITSGIFGTLRANGYVP